MKIKIGVVDTSVPLPVEIQLESDSLSLSPGEIKQFHFVISPQSIDGSLDAFLVLSSTHDFLNLELIHDSPKTFQLESNSPKPIHLKISATDDAVSGTYKVLLGTQLSDVSVSKFVTVTID